VIEPFLNALPLVLAPANILAMCIGLVVGLVVGAMPGLTVVTGIAIMIPLTFGLDPLFALGMMAGMYNGGSYGGAIPAILMRVPGTPASVATLLDGHEMTKQGKASYALQVALVSGVIGSVLSAVALIVMSPPLVAFSLMFGPTEYFWLGVLGLATVSSLLGDDLAKGLAACCIGLLLGAVGQDISNGTERYTFGSLQLLEGFSVIVLLTGLFAIPPVLIMIEEGITTGIARASLSLRSQGSVLARWRYFLPVWVRSSVIGIIIGILPGAGGSMSSFLAYNEAKRVAREPELFGKGSAEGVAASECGNGADNAASLIPALALGIPGSGVAAVILGGLLVHGLRPGPQLFRDHPDIVYGFMLQFLITALLLAVFGGLAATRIFGQALRLPPVVLAPIILMFVAVGVYSVNNAIFDLWVLLGVGVVGYALERLDYPAAPVVLGLLLGPMVEGQLRLALTISGGRVEALLMTPVAVLLAALSVAVLLMPAWRRWRAGGRTTP